MCIRMMEEKMMRSAYKSINEYVDDVSTEVVFNRRKSYIAHLTTVLRVLDDAHVLELL